MLGFYEDILRGENSHGGGRGCHDGPVRASTASC